jgi:hypothetical protein
MKFQDWWSKNALNYWGRPVRASKDAWNAAIEAAAHEADVIEKVALAFGSKDKAFGANCTAISIRVLKEK